MFRSSIAALGIVLQSAGCAATPPAGHGALHDITVDTHGHDADGDFCADFSLTAAQAKAFLDRSAVLTPVAAHDGLDVLPCWVKGTARSASGVWRWEARAGGTGKLISPAGEVQLIACKDCDDLLGGQAPKK